VLFAGMQTEWPLGSATGQVGCLTMAHPRHFFKLFFQELRHDVKEPTLQNPKSKSEI
jgi:hypothetical protein